MMTMTLKEFLEWTRGSYKSIDVRCAAAKVDGHWQNGLTLVRFSYKSKTEVEREHEHLSNRWRKVDTEKFKVLLTAFEIDEVGLVSRAFDEGKCLAPPAASIQVELGQKTDLMSLQAEFPSYNGYTRKREEWQSFHATAGTHLKNLYEDKEIQESLWSLGFVGKATGREAYEVIEEFLEADYYQPGTGFNLLIIAPLYARLERDMKIEGNRFEFKVLFHKYFDKSLEVDAIVRENNQLKYKEGPLAVFVGECEEIDKDLRLLTKQIQVPELTEKDSIQISLLSTSPRLLIQSLTHNVRDFVALRGIEPAQNPLLSALSRFCLGKEGVEIKDYLTTEEGERPQDKFEQKITRLLNLCGYSVARIGKSKQLEILKDATAPVKDRGKADILAYSERVSGLLLAECTTEIPKEDDIFKLKTAAAILQNELFERTSVRVIPLLFTDVPQFDIKEIAGVRLINANDVDSILSDVLEWRKVDQIMFKYFLPPSLPSLEI